MGTEPNYCYKQDKKLVYSNEHFENVLDSSQYDAETASCTPFPNDYLLAQFSKWAYSETFENLPAGWELLTTARNKKFYNGYFGVSFWNPKFCQVVIAHRGTELSNLGALFSDFKLTFNWNKTNQAESAATFVYKVGEIIKKKMSSDGPRYQLSITGHSLGAWLAQMTTFTLKYFTLLDDKFVEDFNYGENIHAHTVVYESPGCKRNLEELSKHFVPSFVKRKFGNYYSLDMTVYLSEINYINCINIHVGTIYKIRSTTHSIKDILQEFNSETGEIHKEMVLDSKSGFFAALKVMLKPVTKIDFKTITANANQHSMNVFDDTEGDFIRDWIYIRDFQPDSINHVKDPLPYFEVDYEYDLIKGDNVIKTIALIKNYKRTKMFVSNVLSANVLFKMRTDQFKDSLVQYCSGFYIKDKYGLKTFVMSNQQILNISVKSDLPDGYRLETSVLNNICTFYNTTEPNLNYFKSGKYNFVSWNLLCTVLQSHASVFDNLDISMLILECGDFDEKDVQSINNFLTSVNFKIVILSDGNFPFQENKSVVEVNGFSDTVVFQDLEENSQKRLIKQKSIFLNNQKMSLESLFKFNDDTYNHLNSALPSDLLLHLLTIPDTECLSVDTTYRNILNGITIELYKEVNVNRNNLKSIKNSLMFIENEGKEITRTENSSTALSIFKENVDFEKECLENLSKQSNKIVYLFTKKDDKIFLNKIFRSDLYIKRNIAHLRLVKSSIFKDTDANQLFYLCGNKDVFDKISAKLNSDRYIYLTEEQAKLKLQQTKAWAHILKLEDDKSIRLLGSRGNVQSLKQHLIMDEDIQKPLSEEELANENIVILSGDAGVGKSSIIKLLYLYLQKTHWVFVIQLAHANFENFILNYNNIARFILNTYGIISEYAQFLLSFCLRYPTNIPIYLIFDGFNEMLSTESKKIFMDIINILKYSPNVKILVTTRTYACKELENGISVIASYFLPTEVEINIVNYLTKFWFSQMQVLEDKVDFQQLQDLAKSIMNAASKFFGESVPTFLSVPLHVRIMAEIFAPNSSINHESAFADFLVPYQKLIETHCNNYLTRCDFPNNEFLKDIVIDGIYKKMYKLAMIELFRFNMEFRIEKDIDELNKIGLLQSSTNIVNFSFLHDSVRDYFISHFLNLWLEGKLVCSDWEIDTYIMRNFLLKDQHKDIRIFLNCHLRNSNVSLNTVRICRERLRKLYIENKNLLFNEQESFYHVCLKENLDFLVQKFLIELIEDEDTSIALLCKRNFELKTPLLLLFENVNAFDELDENNTLLIFLKKVNQLPIQHIKVILLSTFFTYFTTFNQFSGITKISNSYENVYKVLREIEQPFKQINDFLTACIRNKSKNLIKTLEGYDDDVIKKYLVMVTNPSKQTGLHLTISEKIILELLKFGADINFQDHHGLTPLLRSIIGDKTETALLLIKEGADVTIPDHFNNSPLMHAAKNGNEEIVKVLFDSNQVDAKGCNRFGTTALMFAARNGNKNIVKCLLDMRVSVNEVDQTGLSALFHCIKTNQIHLVKLFKQYNADLDVQDIYGVTPLLDSIKKSNWNAVNTLLDNGADPFIASYSDDYPVKVLIQKEKTNILKKILTNANEVVTSNDESFKCLDDYDKSYIYKYVLNKSTL